VRPANCITLAGLTRWTGSSRTLDLGRTGGRVATLGLEPVYKRPRQL